MKTLTCFGQRCLKQKPGNLYLESMLLTRMFICPLCGVRNNKARLFQSNAKELIVLVKLFSVVTIFLLLLRHWKCPGTAITTYLNSKKDIGKGTSWDHQVMNNFHSIPVNYISIGYSFFQSQWRRLTDNSFVIVLIELLYTEKPNSTW